MAETWKSIVKRKNPEKKILSLKKTQKNTHNDTDKQTYMHK